MTRLHYVGLVVHNEIIDVFSLSDDDPAAVVENRIAKEHLPQKDFQEAFGVRIDHCLL